ncbi:hypothetical protein FGO68_gene181 [Halteria grandinella]|uniref:Uncharacterized protein n=1 Tax=Halteria grandinella TaxID=5974 RepID=A0A8J8P7U4_HALGN|nr:hypothetical protein FGO68_gene181 [Halteria grandinella]
MEQGGGDVDLFGGVTFECLSCCVILELFFQTVICYRVCSVSLGCAVVLFNASLLLANLGSILFLLTGERFTAPLPPGELLPPPFAAPLMPTYFNRLFFYFCIFASSIFLGLFYFGASISNIEKELWSKGEAPSPSQLRLQCSSSLFSKVSSVAFFRLSAFENLTVSYQSFYNI